MNNINNETEFSIVDTGIGISRSGLARLFQPVEQLDGGVAPKFEGTGLMLEMANNFVELHGETFGVESKTGEGSRFWFRLRANNSGAEAPTSPAPTKPAPTKHFSPKSQDC